MEHTLTAADALARLEEPFASKDVKWLVAATSRDAAKAASPPTPIREPTQIGSTWSSPQADGQESTRCKHSLRSRG